MSRRKSRHRKRFEIAKQRRKGAQKPFYLNLTSMVDMFTIILVFLLAGYAVTDESFSPPNNVNLPFSRSERIPSITVKLAVSPSEIQIEDRTIVRLDQGKLRQEDMQGLVIFPLFRELQTIAADLKNQAPAEGGKPAERRLILFGDRSIPFATLKRVLYTAGQAEFEGFRFSVIRKGSF